MIHKDETTALPSNTDCALSILATAYHLMRSNPSRFKKDESTAGFVWGFCDEDWNRAVNVIRFVVDRRSKAMRPYLKPLRTADTYTFGYADDESIDEANNADQDPQNEMSASIMQEETDHIDRLVEGTSNRCTLAEEEVRSLVQQLPSVSSIDEESTREIIVDIIVSQCKNNPRLVAGLLSGRLAEDLDHRSQGFDAIGTTRRNLTHQAMSITNEEKDEVRQWLNTRINVAHEGPSKDLGASSGSETLFTNEDYLDLYVQPDDERCEDDQEIQRAHDSSLDAQDLEEKLEELDRTRAAKNAAEMEEVRQRRARLGERLPDDEDLEAICKLYSVPLDTLQVNPHVEQTRNLPTQVVGTSSTQYCWPLGSLVIAKPSPDAHHLKKLLESPIRSAFLLSECGTGKTRVYCTMLKWLADDRERQAREGTITLAEGERLYKPIFIALPSAAVDQCFTEISQDFKGVFNVFAFYSNWKYVKDLRRRAKTLGYVNELQALVDKLARKFDDPMVRRNLCKAEQHPC